jgi:hypothetical protein
MYQANIKNTIKPLVTYKGRYYHLENKPMTKAPDGHGYMGAIMYNQEEGTIQCHVCGQFFLDLTKHLASHKIDPSDYKKKYGLSPTNKLLSPKTRELKIWNQIERFNNMTPEERQNIVEGMKNKPSMKGKRYNQADNPMSVEQRNLRDTCPQQLIEKLNETAKKLGRAPTRREITFEKALRVVFGSYNKALEEAGLTTNPNHHGFHTKESLIQMLKQFVSEHGRIPTTADTRTGELPRDQIFAEHFGSWALAKQAANLPVFGVTHGNLYIRKEDYVPRKYRTN